MTTLCAPPTVWRMLIQEDLAAYPVKLRELVGAGEPLNPEVIEQVHDGLGPDHPRRLRPDRDHRADRQLAGADGQARLDGPAAAGLPMRAARPRRPASADEGEICLRAATRARRPDGRATQATPTKTAEAMRDGFYHTGDVAARDADGYITYVGRADDVFKASDYRISPFELESVLIEHPAVAEAAVVPSPDPMRLAVPKAFVILRPATRRRASSPRTSSRFLRERLAPYKRIRRLEFAELPKTISGKIRRVELRAERSQASARQRRGELEFFEEDFPELKG